HYDPTPPRVEGNTIREAAANLLQAMRKRFGRAILSRIQPLDIYLRDTEQILRVFPGECRCELSCASAETAAHARYVMCSQVAWYAFAHTWGWSVIEGTGMYVDRQFAEKGENELWRRLVNELSTDILRFSSPGRLLRTLEFLWGKKFEIYYHLFGKPISDDAVTIALAAGQHSF